MIKEEKKLLNNLHRYILKITSDINKTGIVCLRQTEI